VLYCYEKMFHNLFMILVIHKFCCFNLASCFTTTLQPSVSCRLRYMPRFPWSHHWRARPTPARRSSLVHHQSSGTYHHTRLLQQKSNCVCLRRELKADQHKKLPDDGEDDRLIIVVGPPLRHSGAEMTPQSMI
jgi:hypothetical protein